MPATGFPVELPLDEYTAFNSDEKNTILSTLVYDFTRDSLKLNTHLATPDGSIEYVEIPVRGTVEDVPELSFHNRKIETEIMIDGGEALLAVLRIDPYDPDRFYGRIGDTVWGTGRRLNRQHPLLWFVAGAAAAAVGYTLGSGGDVTLEIPDVLKLELDMPDDESE